MFQKVLLQCVVVLHHLVFVFRPCIVFGNSRAQQDDPVRRCDSFEFYRRYRTVLYVKLNINVAIDRDSRRSKSLAMRAAPAPT
mgnify:CR=1 FL=1